MGALSLNLRRERSAPGAARQAIEHRFAELGPARLADLALVVSELVSNAVVHGRGTITLKLQHDGHASSFNTTATLSAGKSSTRAAASNNMSATAARTTSEAAACSSSKRYPAAGASTRAPPTSGSNSTRPEPPRAWPNRNSATPNAQP